MIQIRKSKQNQEVLNNTTPSKKNVQVLKKINDIHKTSVATVAQLPAIKKLSLLKSSSCSAGIRTIQNTTTVCPDKDEIYQERKRMLPEYKDLFAALLRLPDKEMQKKIFEVINNHKTVEKRSVETQTDFIESSNALNSILYTNANTTSEQISTTEDKIINIDKSSNDQTTDLPKKRKRRRKVSLPQANKESRTKQLVKMNQPKVALKNSQSRTFTCEDAKVQINCIKRPRVDSCFSECVSDVADIFDDGEVNPIREFETASLPLENGLLPIQDAVVKNQISKLWIHIRIWKDFRKLDLNHLLTDEDEDLLQLAIINRCDPTIVHILLEHGLNSNCLDNESNTIVHLAILNDIDVTSMELLTKKIDVKLLLTVNDEGYTALHLAVRQDRFLLAECLINILDKRLTNKIYYKMEFDQLETDEVLLKNQFKIYYEKICLQMETDEDSNSLMPNNHEIKQQLLQIGDRRSGNIALYFAIDYKYEHLIYFLLAHLTDPRTENFSGQDCKSFFSEYGKSSNLSLNIDNTMEKVITILT